MCSQMVLLSLRVVFKKLFSLLWPEQLNFRFTFRVEAGEHQQLVNIRKCHFDNICARLSSPLGPNLL